MNRPLADQPETEVAEIARMQKLLQPFSVQARNVAARMPNWSSIALPRKRRWMHRWPTRIAAVLMIAIAAGSVFLNHRLQWAKGAAWSINSAAGAASTLRVSEQISTGPSEQLKIAVARIGAMQLSENSAIQLVQTGPAQHRVRLLYGQMRAKIWAPPNWFGVSVGEAEVLDLGCDFEIDQARDGNGVIRVYSGWIAYRIADTEVLVPADHSAHFDSHHIGIPIRVAAKQPWRDQIAALERAISAGVDSRPMEIAIARTASDDDRFSLLSLLTRHPQLAQGPLYKRLAGMFALDAENADHRNRWASGDQAAIDQWWQRLPRQPKQWWRHWPDVI